jgi:hypothetical protein
MPRFGFCNGSYRSQSPNVDAQCSINWYPEATENPGSRVAMALYPTPGLVKLCTLPGPSVRGSYTINARTFKIAGTHLCQVMADGTFTDYGGTGTPNNNILDDGLPATMVAGGTASGEYPGQLLIASGGTLTAFNLATNGYIAITSAPANVLMVEYLDGYFVALVAGNDFQVSNPEDCTTWPGLSISQVSVFSDALLSMIANDRLLWIFGGKRAVAYYTSGGALFPFSVVNGGFAEMGILGQFSVVRLNNTIYWLASDERGGAIVAALNGYTPQRVSDHALEYALSTYGKISDAVAWASREQGHNFYNLWFPTANKTWVLDADLGIWHQRTSTVAGVQGANLARCHTFNFNSHLVGDRLSGNVYQQNIQTYTDNGAPIVRTRVGPTVSTENRWMFLNEFVVDFEVGLGPIPPLTDAAGNPRGPQAMFSYSTDFGKNWGNERMIDCGQAGDYRIQASDRRLGSFRNWTPKVTVSDPIPWRIADAYLNPTSSGQERLAKILAKMQ